MAQTTAIRVDGLDDLVRAFHAADRTLKEDLRDALLESASPVRRDAQVLAPAQIGNLSAGQPWARFRIGASGRSMVYVAPVERGVKARGNARLRRPRFKQRLLLPMEQALTVNRQKVINRLDGMLGEVKAVWERHG